MYYKFGSNFDTTKFAVEINVEEEAIHSTIQGQHLTLRCRPYKQSRPIRSPSMGSNRQESGPPTGNRTQNHRKREKNYLHTINPQSKAWATNTQQDCPINMVINSQLLDMQGYKGLMG
jgi:hypothetical protein